MSEGINLLDPNKKSTSAFLRQLKTTRTFVVGVLFLVSVFSVILFILVAISPLPGLQKQEKSLRQTLTLSKSDMVKYTLVNERTNAISGILAKRQLVDQTLNLVEGKLTSDLTVTALQEGKGTLALTVESQSLKSLDTFLNALIGFVQEKKAFSQVTLTDFSTDQTTNAYSASVSLSLL